MSVSTMFLGWDRPLLAALADELGTVGMEASSHGSLPRLWDLSGVLVVLPTRRAGRRLIEILADAAQAGEERRIFVPPVTTTAAALPQALLQDPSACAGPLEMLLLWSRVMATMRQSAHDAGLLVPDGAQLGTRLRWAAIPARLHQELASVGLTGADAGRALRQGSAAARRWKAFADLEMAYRSELGRLGLTEPGDAALLARSAECLRPYSLLVVAGVTNRAPTLSRMLMSVPFDILTMVHAPVAEAYGFATDGSLRSEVWGMRMVDIPDDRIEPAEDALDQAVRSLRTLSEHCSHLAPDEITLCLADPSLATPIRVAFSQAGLSVHSALGTPIDRSRPIRLLRAIGAFGSNPSAADLAAVFRHPDVEQVVLAPSDRLHVLDALDRYRRTHVPTELRSGPAKEGEASRPFERSLHRVEHLAGPLREASRPLSDWPTRIAKILETVYGGGRSESAEAETERNVLERLVHTLDQMSVLARTPSLDERVSGVDAIGALCHLLEAEAVPEPPREQALDVVDWAELLHDDAPAAIVLGVNDGVVPPSPPDDPFLTDRLRGELGLPDAEQLRSQAAYVLTAKLHSCAHTYLVFGRHSADGSPIAPSRLLYACPPDVALQRARRFLVGAGIGSGQPTTPFQHSTHARILAPAPSGLEEPLVRLPVTAFRDYLACPYRFYLRRVLRLETPREPGDELDAPEFGSLVHEVLRCFGREGPTQSCAVAEVTQFMAACLNDLALERFQSNRSPAVRVQLAHALARLERLAAWQAAHVEDGWITCPEWVEVECEGQLDIDSEAFGVHGRIDRIDYNAEQDAYLILDYKTSEQALGPDATHRSGPAHNKRWIDLQLPLYRFIAPCRQSRGAHLGYIQLGAAPDGPILALADWDEDVLADADETIANVVRGIRAGVYWPPSDGMPFTADGFEPICLDRCLERADLLRRSVG